MCPCANSGRLYCRWFSVISKFLQAVRPEVWLLWLIKQTHDEKKSLFPTASCTRSCQGTLPSRYFPLPRAHCPLITASSTWLKCHSGNDTRRGGGADTHSSSCSCLWPGVIFHTQASGCWGIMANIRVFSGRHVNGDQGWISHTRYDGVVMVHVPCVHTRSGCTCGKSQATKGTCRTKGNNKMSCIHFISQFCNYGVKNSTAPTSWNTDWIAAFRLKVI